MILYIIMRKRTRAHTRIYAHAYYYIKCNGRMNDRNYITITLV